MREQHHRAVGRVRDQIAPTVAVDVSDGEILALLETPIEPSSFSQVAVGDEHGCAIRSDGAVECWGGDLFGQAEPP